VVSGHCRCRSKTSLQSFIAAHPALLPHVSTYSADQPSRVCVAATPGLKHPRQAVRVGTALRLSRTLASEMMSLSASASAASLGARSRVAGARLPRSARCVLPARPQRGTRTQALLRPYTVRTGDKLQTIASKRGMSVQEVRECNKGRTLSAEVKARPYRLFAHSLPVYPYTLAGSIHGLTRQYCFSICLTYRAVQGILSPAQL